MSKLELIRGLYEYNEWANGHVLEAASRLSEEEFSKAQGASYGSVEGNLLHVAGAQVGWLHRWMTGQNPPSSAWQFGHGFGAVGDAFARSHEELGEFVSSLTDEALDSVLVYTDSRGNANERVLWQLMIHLVNHGTHHRAETAMALTALGKPMRELDYVFFEIERGG